MTELPDYESLEKYVKDQPDSIINQLPDSTERRRAKEHVDLAYRYAKEARERAKVQK